MNLIQILTFFLYAISLYFCGMGVLVYLGYNERLRINRYIEFAEALLLGGTVLVGEMLVLSMVKLYSAPFLWGMVVLNAAVFLIPSVRKMIIPADCSKISIPTVLFYCLLALFFFRNIYYLVDVDSHSTYLYTQKLWLEYGTSLFADRALDFRVFVSQFDTVPYALGLSIFGRETLFPQMVNWLWRVVVLLMVFGYTKYRFNDWMALAASMLVLFNVHFFFSGANQYVLLNATIIGMLFGCAYNFWEARDKCSTFRFLLALLLVSQLIANKFTMVYVTVFVVAIGLFIQEKRLEIIKDIWKTRPYFVSLMMAAFICFLWFIKNGLATGLIIFPVGAGHFHVLGWSPAFEETMHHVFRGVSISEFIKYSSYMFIWPGINAAKIVWLGIVFLPIIYLASQFKQKFHEKKFLELSYWLMFSFFVVMGICLASHQDPRYFRFNIAIAAYIVVLLIDYIFQCCLPRTFHKLGILVVLAIALLDARVVNFYGGTFKYPTYADNLNVLTSKVTMDDIVKKHYPQNILAQEGFNKNLEDALHSAWMFKIHPSDPSAFLLPLRPQLNIWLTTIIDWDSYNARENIIRDLREGRIEHVMSVNNGSFQLMTLDEYASYALQYNRFPKEIYFPYTMPQELTDTHL